MLCEILDVDTPAWSRLAVRIRFFMPGHQPKRYITIKRTARVAECTFSERLSRLCLLFHMRRSQLTYNYLASPLPLPLHRLDAVSVHGTILILDGLLSLSTRTNQD